MSRARNDARQRAVRDILLSTGRRGVHPLLLSRLGCHGHYHHSQAVYPEIGRHSLLEVQEGVGKQGHIAAWGSTDDVYLRPYLWVLHESIMNWDPQYGSLQNYDHESSCEPLGCQSVGPAALLRGLHQLHSSVRPIGDPTRAQEPTGRVASTSTTTHLQKWNISVAMRP